MRTYVYVDAFNLFYGCLKGRPHKWLNLAALCRHQLQPHHVIVRIKYFTALVSARDDPDRPNRQQLYLRALRTIPEVRIYFGKFQTHERRMPAVVPPGVKQTYATVSWTNEKGSDVNLATHLLSDAYEGRFAAAVVITGDSDLVAPIRLVAQNLGLTVGILNPQHRASRSLVRAATFYERIRPGTLAASVFPDQLTDSKGVFHKPPSW